ncbi:glutamate racemase [Pontibacillus halophilus JSM 076056 = DSM 19796]|uniref:Glutamate racemase n=1 Tax=Pontibacillus halophilus JSM 076056 = DSM 19796 TaxID=1385510 RepID=A0A0A5GJM3_9BACI|nr:glutamate racemase [Pontibacillus halophilus]KGX93446.1 glutamate racemase [Pontibacillus halophilus JSM 076056 = DSM 19796]
MNRPIGVIDSGVGGLTVARELMRQLPKEKLIYVGDTLRCPYGPRPKEEVIQFTREMVDFLLEKNIKMLVIACNTATAFTLEMLRNELDIPVVGVIQPGARAAIKTSQNQHIGVIGTEGTISSQAYPQALKHINPSIHVNDLACPRFVPLVEMGVLEGEDAYQVVAESLVPMKEQNHIDTLILGCTHYPLLSSTIQEVMGNDIKIISSGDETAREVSVLLEYYDTFSNGYHPPQHEFYATGDRALFENIANAWFDSPVEHIEIITLGT